MTSLDLLIYFLQKGCLQFSLYMPIDINHLLTKIIHSISYFYQRKMTPSPISSTSKSPCFTPTRVPPPRMPPSRGPILSREVGFHCFLKADHIYPLFLNQLLKLSSHSLPPPLDSNILKTHCHILTFSFTPSFFAQ
jgi:hypothetical protein